MPKRVMAEAAGALPARYRRLLIDQQTGVNGVWDYDYSVHNPTPFAGLENGIANCYTNSLWQVLHFIPELRCAESTACCTVKFECDHQPDCSTSARACHAL